ncbi:MAG: winged helix-turn-helix domain-containing protein [Candidatus Omnitrophota bacterium]
MQEQYYFIGEAAGKIYKALEENNELAESKLRTKAGIEDLELLHQGLGWLAREGKVCFKRSGKTTKISLFKA